MKLSEVAKKYLGEKELAGNVFNDSTELGKKLHAAGQKDGDPWCALFVEACLKECDPNNFAVYDKLCSASAVQTFKNFAGAKFKVLLVPEPDSIVIFQQYKDGVAQWQGHAGIVSEVKSSWEFTSIEGNTSEKGSREGVIVGSVNRKVLKDVKNGLKVMGFIKV